MHCANGRPQELPLNTLSPKHHWPCESVNKEVFIEPKERPPILERLMENRVGTYRECRGPIRKRGTMKAV